MLNFFKKIFYWIIFYSGVIYFFRFIYRKIYHNPLKILYSHRIIAESDKLYPLLRGLGYLTLDEFERKIRYFSRKYKFINLEEGMSYLQKGDRPSNCVILTFDDGYKCNYTRAFQVLKKYNVPATIFLTTDLLEGANISWRDKLMEYIVGTEQKSLFFPEVCSENIPLRSMREKIAAFLKINRYLKSIEDEKIEGFIERLKQQLGLDDSFQLSDDLMLSLSEIREMADSGLITFGAHTMTHPILTRVPMERAEQEIKQSKHVIENRLGQEVKFFAYPNGDYNEQIKNIVKNSGYACALTTVPGGDNDNSDIFALTRDGFISESLFITAINIAGVLEVLKFFCSLFKLLKRKIKEGGFVYWLPTYVSQKIFSPNIFSVNHPKHIILCIVDHFEPFHGGVSDEVARDRVLHWRKKYPEMADKYVDADGIKPRHTWFYPPHLDHSFLSELVGLSSLGYGEIEMHLHHNRMLPFPDTSDTLRDKILKCVDDYSKYGIFCLPDGSKKFAFVHGDWSLDNSCGPEICGVNDEIKILKECGCFADFTFPSLGESQPAMINKIYYAKDDSASKSYNWGKEVIVNGSAWGDLLMVSGVIGFRWKGRNRKFLPAIEISSLDHNDRPSRERIDYWVKNAIVIPRRPEWKFIKLHVHGAPPESWDSVLGKTADEMHEYFRDNYNDGKNFVFHYVSAREMVNIIKAAEAGKSGNPGEYRDFSIPPYIYLSNR